MNHKFSINFQAFPLLSRSVFLQQHLIIISITFVNIFEIFSRNLLISIYTEGAERSGVVRAGEGKAVFSSSGLGYNYIISIDHAPCVPTRDTRDIKGMT